MIFFGAEDSSFQAQVLANEEKIIWLEKPAKYPYVREMEGLYLEKEKFDYGFGVLKLIGYGVVNKPVVDFPEQKLYRRRSWWIHPDDLFADPQYLPEEAVIPSKIQVGKPSPLGRDCKKGQVLYWEKNKDGERTLILLHANGCKRNIRSA
ncbi:MAG: DUF6009 family protein [Verrucomicrobiota bacterium]